MAVFCSSSPIFAVRINLRLHLVIDQVLNVVGRNKREKK